MAAFAGHQADALDPEHAGDHLQLGPQGLELQVDQVRTEQVDGVSLLATDLAAIDVDAVLDQQVEDVAKDADAVLAVHLDAHGGARKLSGNGIPPWPFAREAEISVKIM